MTRNEALSLFQLPLNTTAADIEAVYQDRFNNVTQQLRNAPTDALKAIFQKNMSELAQAYTVLTVGDTDNLPSTKPIALQETAALTSEQGANSTAADVATDSPRMAKQLESLKKQKTYFLAALIGFAAVLSYFVVQYFELKGLKPKAELYDKIEKKLFNRKFALKNAGKKSYEITAYHITYLDDEGNLADMEEGMKGEKYSFIFEPDRTFSITKVVGKNIVFDGKALSYTIILYETGINDALPKVFSGLCSDGNDTPLNPD